MALAAPRQHRSLAGAALAAAPGARRLLALVAPLVREHAASVAAFAAVDYGAFGLSRYAGWIVTGVSVLLLDFVIRG